MYKVVPATGLTFSRPAASSSESPHASSARSGRVAVAARAYETLAAIASLEAPTLRIGLPRGLDIAQGGSLIVERPAEFDGIYEVRSPADTLVGKREMSSTGAHVLAREDGYYDTETRVSWSDVSSPLFGAHLNQFGEMLATTMMDGALRMLVASPAPQTADHPDVPDYTWAGITILDGTTIPRRTGWDYSAPEPGVGAIDGAGYTVIALPSGRLVVLLPDGDERGYGVLGLDAPIDPKATDLSIIPPYVMVLYGGGDAGALAAFRSKSMPTSHLDARRADGSLAWHAPLPFLPTQPPIDGEGRVYIVGAGIAAMDMNGHTLWSAASSVPLRAQAFADGTLAVVRGSELQIVSSDGTIRQSLRAAEEITTYPAIGSDGAVWVASAKTLYVAR